MELQCQMNVTNLYQCAPGFCTEKRILPYHYLLYVHKGKGWYRIGNHTYTAAAGDLFYCPPNEANTIIASEEDPFLLSGIEFVCNQEQLLEDGLPTAEPLLEVTSSHLCCYGFCANHAATHRTNGIPYPLFSITSRIIWTVKSRTRSFPGNFLIIKIVLTIC